MLWVRFPVALGVIEGLKIQPPPFAKPMSFTGLKWMGLGAGTRQGAEYSLEVCLWLPASAITLSVRSQGGGDSA